MLTVIREFETECYGCPVSNVTTVLEENPITGDKIATIKCLKHNECYKNKSTTINGIYNPNGEFPF